MTENVEELDNMFAWQETWKLTKSMTVRYDKFIYLVGPTEENARIAGENIMISAAGVNRCPDAGHKSEFRNNCAPL